MPALQTSETLPGRRPSVTIGIPVRNGAATLPAALDSLLAQDYPDIEIVVSDNASTDGTREILDGYAVKYPSLRVVHLVKPIDVLANFRAVLQEARGELFMWAADDDRWNSGFVSALAAQLHHDADAVLAAPRVEHVDASEHAKIVSVDRAPIPFAARHVNLSRFLQDHAASWVYGMFRREWLVDHVAGWVTRDDSAWGSDVVWLAGMLVRYRVTGSGDAVLTKQTGRRFRGPASEVDRFVFWRRQAGALLGSAWESPTLRERLRFTSLVLGYCHRKYLRRGNIVGTTVRYLKVGCVACQAMFRGKEPASSA